VLNNKGGLRCLFVTASPVLTYEIKKHYENLLGMLREEIRNKKKEPSEDEFE
jgi:hypothetical protein